MIHAQPPQFMVVGNGPRSTVRDVRFTPDGHRLLVSGDDKVVHVYQVDWDGRQSGPPIVTYACSLNWEIARGDRGSIACMSVNPQGTRMVMGGTSARQQAGDLVRFDLATNRVLDSLPSPVARAEMPIGDSGHVHPISDVAHSTGGGAILSRDVNGGMFLWRGTGSNQNVGAGQQLRVTELSTRRFAPRGLFIDD
ncbi:MAG: hypothetical protein AAF745_01545, partial [Planctomycetota bacterium]